MININIFIIQNYLENEDSAKPISGIIGRPLIKHINLKCVFF